MHRVMGVVMLATGVFAAGLLGAAGGGPPPWAYGFTTLAGGGTAPSASAPPVSPVPSAPAAQPDPTPRSLPGSSRSFPLAEIRDAFGPADWFPDDHPPMPDVVAHGRRPDVRACSLCHYPNGKGRPENAGIAGLPPAYFLQTMNDFRSDARKSAEPRKANTNLMITIAKGMTDAELKGAAEYFSAMKWTPWIRVVEAGTVPRTRISGGMFLALEISDTEPIGDRIIEVPEDTERTETLRDPHSGFVAYVPIGSIRAGEALVTTGGGKTTRCAVCHGADLKGLGPVPGIAGRSPSYTVRQLYDTQQGARKGMWADLMKPVVANLSTDDMLAIAAYTASRSDRR
jgi:cytochrome c553